ncbi:MAG: 5'/3'-nucleotidase SurE [Simkaniaceae bacterium]|nr:5'/3'-nucleotidase SurE [Simkaniaceae bacterium]MCF7852504.1 5'/3'-nucleotidase SurE [Simkaniaceae bacterium]
MSKPFILLINDDGIDADGLKSLYHALKKDYNIVIAAPAREQSGCGIGLTLHRPIQIDPVEWDENTLAYKITGKPADCVKLSLSVILDSKPDMIISGINHGSNAGRNALYSGTVGGIMEGAIRGIPGIAFSCTHEEQFDFETASRFIPQIVRHFFDYPMPAGTLINVNFPDCPQERVLGIKYARQGLSYIMDNPFQDELSKGYFISKQAADFEDHEESDTFYLKQGYITATPIHVNDMTDHNHYISHKSIFEEALKHSFQ